MSVLIKNIKTPKDNTCSYCFFNNGASCRATPPDKTTKRDEGYVSRQFVYPEGVYSRPEWCPLVEVPGSHGRLIDANELERMKHWTDDLYETEYVEMEDITNAPTVIEAEEQEHGCGKSEEEKE